MKFILTNLQITDEINVVENIQKYWLNENEEQYFKLCDLHQKDERHYHNLTHLYTLFQLLEKYQKRIERIDLLKASIWYHDSVYKSTSKKNEEKSAELAIQALKNEFSKEDLAIIYTYIISTKKHETILPHSDNKFFLDFDLAILATNRNTYIEYAKLIRKEYSIYPTFLYNRGRKKALTHFLERKEIFYTEQFKIYEDQARSNLQYEIESL